MSELSISKQAAFKLRIANPSDAKAMARVSMAAFQSSPISRALHGPTGTSPSGYASVFADISRGLDPQAKDPNVTYVVAEANSKPHPESISDITEAEPSTTQAIRSPVEPKTPEVIGFAKWHFYTAGASEKPVTASEDDTSSSSTKSTKSIATAFFGGCYQLRHRQIRGEPCGMITTLAIDPAWHGRRVGSALVSWGTRQADDLGLDCWLTTTPMAHAMYRKCGFQDVDLFDLDLQTTWGIDPTTPDENWGQALAPEIVESPPTGYLRTVLMRRKAVQTD